MRCAALRAHAVVVHPSVRVLSFVLRVSPFSRRALALCLVLRLCMARGCAVTSVLTDTVCSSVLPCGPCVTVTVRVFRAHLALRALHCIWREGVRLTRTMRGGSFETLHPTCSTLLCYLLLVQRQRVEVCVCVSDWALSPAVDRILSLGVLVAAVPHHKGRCCWGITASQCSSAPSDSCPNVPTCETRAGTACSAHTSGIGEAVCRNHETAAWCPGAPPTRRNDTEPSASRGAAGRATDPDAGCWHHLEDRSANLNDFSFDRCSVRYTTLAEAQHACAALAALGCGGVVKDGGMDCNRCGIACSGVARFELRGGKRIKSPPGFRLDVWMLVGARADASTANAKGCQPGERWVPRPAHQTAKRHRRPNATLLSDLLDPTPLSYGWWLPAGEGVLAERLPRAARRSALECTSAERTYIEIEGTYGQCNNLLREWVHALQLVVTRQEPHATLVMPAGYEWARIFDFFDWAAATRGWACVVESSQVPSGAARVKLPAEYLYWMAQREPMGSHFVGHALHQLLLRPLAGVRALVAKVTRCDAPMTRVR